MYLHYSSYHPKHQKTSIPYSQAIRLRRICSTLEIDRQTTTNLKNRGYPRIMVQQAIDKALKQDRSQLLGITNTPKKTENVIPFIITYNPYKPPINRILQNNKHILQTAGELKCIREQTHCGQQKSYEPMKTTNQSRRHNLEQGKGVRTL